MKVFNIYYLWKGNRVYFDTIKGTRKQADRAALRLHKIKNCETEFVEVKL